MMNKTCFEKNFRARAESYAHRLVQCNDILQSKPRISGPVVHSFAVRNYLKTRGYERPFSKFETRNNPNRCGYERPFPMFETRNNPNRCGYERPFPMFETRNNPNRCGYERQFQGSRRATIRTAALSGDP
jgi:hypothetical protein